MRKQLYSNSDDKAFFDRIKMGLKYVETRLEEGRVALQHLELFLVNVACDDPGAAIGSQLVLPLLQVRMWLRAYRWWRCGVKACSLALGLVACGRAPCVCLLAMSEVHQACVGTHQHIAVALACCHAFSLVWVFVGRVCASCPVLNQVVNQGLQAPADPVGTQSMTGAQE